MAITPALGSVALEVVIRCKVLCRVTVSLEHIWWRFTGGFRGETHKNDVLMYCQKKARQCRDDGSMVDRESAELLWKYLQLLIKQNGVCVSHACCRFSQLQSQFSCVIYINDTIDLWDHMCITSPMASHQLLSIQVIRLRFINWWFQNVGNYIFQ